MDPVGAVGNPIDQGQYLATTNPEPVSSGIKKIWGFLDGVRGVTDRVEAISGDVTNISDDIVGAKRTAFELRRDKREFEQDQFLEKATTLRGDNVTTTYAIAGVAALALILFLGK